MSDNHPEDEQYQVGKVYRMETGSYLEYAGGGNWVGLIPPAGTLEEFNRRRDPRGKRPAGKAA